MTIINLVIKLKPPSLAGNILLIARFNAEDADIKKGDIIELKSIHEKLENLEMGTISRKWNISAKDGKTYKRLIKTVYLDFHVSPAVIPFAHKIKRSLKENGWEISMVNLKAIKDYREEQR